MAPTKSVYDSISGGVPIRPLPVEVEKGAFRPSKQRSPSAKTSNGGAVGASLGCALGENVSPCLVGVMVGACDGRPVGLVVGCWLGGGTVGAYATQGRFNQCRVLFMIRLNY